MDYKPAVNIWWNNNHNDFQLDSNTLFEDALISWWNWNKNWKKEDQTAERIAEIEEYIITLFWLKKQDILIAMANDFQAYKATTNTPTAIEFLDQFPKWKSYNTLFEGNLEDDIAWEFLRD